MRSNSRPAVPGGWISANRRQFALGNTARRLAFSLSLLLVLLTLTSLSTQAIAQTAIRPGFNSNTLPANDDGSTPLVPVGFNLDFFGVGYNQLYVNNNGNLTFDGPLATYTPFGLAGTHTKIIAPFFGDVDTRQAGSSLVSYGQGTVGNRPAFGANWPHVACFATPNGGYNTFQVILIDRSDIGAGDFDIEFNFGQIVWDSGQASGGGPTCRGGSAARVGYSNGSTASFELTGSAQDNYFLDFLAGTTTPNPTGLIYNSLNSVQPGRYIFAVRNGNAPLGHAISGTVFGNDTTNPLASARVQVCGSITGGTFCSVTTTNSLGQYNVSALSDGQYDVTAFAPPGTQYQSGTIHVTLAGSDLPGQNIILTGPHPIPPGTTISPTNNGNAGGFPVVYWGNPLTLTTQGCPGGTASYVVTSQDGSTVTSGLMPEDAANSGHYSATIPAFYPHHGWVTVTITLSCPGGGGSVIPFTMYIDPSGQVTDTSGSPVGGATVTLYRSDSSAGPFAVVPDGSSIMDINNRSNPSMTTSQGLFGWDVIAGYYVVRTAKTGCTAPGNPNQGYVETSVMTVPPPATGIHLQLSCPVVYSVCDVNQDGVVSRADISIIMSRLRQTVPPGTMGDVNNDGVITTQDARLCTLQCTNASCTGP